MMKKLLIILLASITSAFPCFVEGPKLIIFENGYGQSDLSSSFDFKECSEKVEKRFLRYLADFEGTLSRKVLRAEKSLKDVKLKQPIKVESLESYINKRISNQTNWKFINLKLVGQNSRIISVKPQESLNVECNNCSNLGNKNIKLELRDPLSGRMKQLWTRGDLAAKTQALISLDNSPVNNKPLSPGQFREVEIYSTKPEVFFTNKAQLVFYKLNRSKNQGEHIKFQDLTPVSLVKMGRPVKVSLKTGALALEGKAIASQSGKLGEVIRLKNVNTKKTIIGKVTNFNEVEIEL